MPFAEINLGDRADPEFYSKENIEIEHSLRDHEARPLSEFCTIVASAFYPAATQLYESGEVPFARCVDCVNYPVISTIQEADFERIPRWFIDQCGQIHSAFRGDIVLSKVGSPCFASIIHDYEQIALSRTVLGLVQIKGINPYYLTVFLRCRYGFNQLLRQREQTIQYQLTLERVRELLVYKPTNEFQSAVEQTLVSHICRIKEAHEQQSLAEQTLLKALGLENWQPPEPLTYTRRASEVKEAKRMDAEFFDPAVSLIIDKLKAHGSEPVSSIVTVGTGFPWNSDYFNEDNTTEGEPFVRIRNCKPGTLSPSQLDRLESTYAADQNVDKARGGDLVIGMDGLKWFYASLLTDECYVNQRVAVLQRGKNTNMSSEYLLAVINSIIGQKQLLRQMTVANTVGHITLDHVRFLLIPKVDQVIHDSITAHIQSAHTARQEAQELLERAKRAVEIAIEEGDPTALKFLEGPG